MKICFQSTKQNKFKYAIWSNNESRSDSVVTFWCPLPPMQCTTYGNKRRKSLMSTFYTMILSGTWVAGGAANVTTEL